MKRVLVWVLVLGFAGVAQADEARASPEAMMQEIVSPEDVRFFMNEARQASRAAAKGELYVPAPEAAARARNIGERMREKGFGLMEALLDQIEQELLSVFPPPQDQPASQAKPDEDIRT
jgi:uncharacterized membrane-anchored protein